MAIDYLKVHGALSVLEYKEEGFLPDALINYLSKLGWSSGDKEIFSVKEFLDLFDLKISADPHQDLITKNFNGLTLNIFPS